MPDNSTDKYDQLKRDFENLEAELKRTKRALEIKEIEDLESTRFALKGSAVVIQDLAGCFEAQPENGALAPSLPDRNESHSRS